MSCNARVKDFGKRLRNYLNTDAAYAILGPDGTWTAGGCWLLAAALAPLLDAPLVGVWSVVQATPVLQHVVLQLDDDCFLDADGVQTERALLRRMVQEEMLVEPFIAPFNPDAARASDIRCPAVSVRRLRTALQRALS
jgi:hypothetical protein